MWPERLFSLPEIAVHSEPNKPWLSVILPIYRGERWIERTLESVAIQADTGIEVVVIDSSPDNATMTLVNRFADRLKLSIVDPAGTDGCYPKMNHGVIQARADHVAWLCQDDLWLPGRVAAVREWIAAAPQAALHLAPTAIIDSDDRVLGVWRCPLKAGAVDPATLAEKLIVQNFVAVVSPVVRRDAWLACGGLDLDLWYTGDWDLWLKLGQQGEVVYHDAVTAGFRIHDESATSTGSRDGADFVDQHRIVVDRHIAAIPAHRRAPARRLADASIVVNAALAAAAHGEARALGSALLVVAGLGPFGAGRYLHRSRIIERAWPRLRAKWTGAL
jgi:glycosyltransferase involved in cell wall biosynthesis